MTINDKKHVSLTYELKEGNNLIESVDEKNPLSFVVGIGKMLPIFEKKIINLSQGDNFNFSLEPNEAYGEFTEKAIIDVPSNVFMKDNKIDENLVKIGNSIPMKMSDGNVMNGVVKSFTLQSVKMDFNHPLAGKKLTFSGKILQVRESRKDELEKHGHECTGCGKHNH